MTEELGNIYQLLSSKSSVHLGFRMAKGLGYTEVEIIEKLFDLIDPPARTWRELIINPKREIKFSDVILQEVNRPSVRYRIVCKSPIPGHNDIPTKWLPCEETAINKLIKVLKLL